MTIKFPENPEDGMVFESSPGLYFQYLKAVKTWDRLDGFDSIGPATPSHSGLMTAEDYRKVERLILPPIQTTLTSDECNTVFKDGRVELVSTNDDLKIESKLKVMDRSKAGESRVDWIIHQNTFGIDFRVNLNRLMDELNNRGRLKYRAVRGPDGDKGPRGDPGKDNVECGPQGDQGADGKNAPYPGTLQEDSNEIEVTTNRAIVDIKNDETNPKKLIVTVGNIGNPNSCPNKAKWVAKNSPWLLATSDSTPVICPVDVACRICDTQIFYMDVTDILEQLDGRYTKVINDIKTAKEALVRTWMTALIEVFTGQKQALCCAIEALTSKARNQEMRNILSGGRYAAAQAEYAFAVTSTPTDLIPRAVPQCQPSDFYPPKGALLFGDVIQNGDVSRASSSWTCDNCYTQITMKSGNIGNTTPVQFDIPAGSYVATTIQCCMDFLEYGSSGVFNVRFNEPQSDDTVVTKTFKSVDRGGLPAASADQAYVGESLAFKHAGGTVAMWIEPHVSSKVEGELVICLQPVHCFNGGCAVIDPELPEFDISDPTCYMASSHIEFYERGWRTGECCGAHISVHGTEFIVVFRSIGIDMTCGGGEYATTPCISKFKSMLGKQVAIAWPTTDGDSFFGLPRDNVSAVALTYDRLLSRAIVNAIQANNVFSMKGSPAAVITEVIVPLTTDI